MTLLKKNERRSRLEKIKKDSRPIRTGIPVPYKGKRHEWNAYRVPLSVLVYNPYNTRIGSRVKTYEKQTGKKLNSENEADVEIIEKFLWESHPEHNNRTLEDLLKNGQREVGIITADGIILHGNRRAFLLNLIQKRGAAGKYKGIDIGHAEYFDTIILPSDADEREINKLEIEYQMNLDPQQDYDAIEKYIKCKDLHKQFHYTSAQIGEMMNESATKIEEYLEVEDLMEEYLEYFKVSGYYTLLRKKEDQFINLNKWVKQFNNLSSRAVEWAYTKEDIFELKEIAFIYIRAGYEGKEFRNIASGRKKGGIFLKKSLWSGFRDRTKKIFETEEGKEVPVKKILKDGGDTEKELQKRDERFQSNVYDALEDNMERSMQVQEDKNLKNRPGELVEKALVAITEIPAEIAAKKPAEMIRELNNLSREITKLINRINKLSK